MDLLRAYRKKTVDSRKVENTVESRRVESRQGKKTRYHLPSTIYPLLSSQKGVALIIALLMSVAIMAMVAGVLYFLTQSTTMSGAGKRYATAAEAADGAVEVMRRSVYLIFHGDSAPNVFSDTGTLLAGVSATAAACLTDAIQNCAGTPCTGSLCTTSITLPGIGGEYTANVSVKRLYTSTIPGGSMEFAKRAGGAPSTAIFYRITTSVIGPNNTTADNAALYRVME